MPIVGERDQLGFLRVDDPTAPQVGGGSRFYFDIGALERRIIIPPKIDAVTAVITDPTAPGGTTVQNFYVVNGVSGSRTAPQQIRFHFDSRLDPVTVNNQTIILQASGGDGIFGNNNNSADRTIDLSGKLGYNPTTGNVTIDLSGIGGLLANDLFRITIFGSGSNVVRDPQGVALDGENTVGGAATGAQLPLPSGNKIPGGNFFLTFSIDSNPPSVVANTFTLAPASDTGRPNDKVTQLNQPSFTGRITDVFPPANPLLGQTVFLDWAGPDRVFATNDDQLNIGTATTNAQGLFTVKVGSDAAATGLVNPSFVLPNTNVNVGPDGLLGTADDTGYDVVRVRVKDPSGNVSNANAAAAQTTYVVDTRGPRITASSPAPDGQANVAGNSVVVSVTTNENVNPATVNSASVRAFRAGPDGQLGTADDVPITVSNNIKITPVPNAMGGEIIQITLTGVTVNDRYRVSLLGSGTNVIRDWAGNALDGEFAGVFSSGNGQPGGNFNLDFVVLNSSMSKVIFVGQNAVTDPTAAQGSRANPYSTIMAGMGASGIGDTVAVLPGVYTESVTLKSLVKLLSADPNSSDGRYLPGAALNTIIRRPSAPATSMTVTGTDLISLPNFDTELGGFTIASPLVSNPATGPIDPNSFGVFLSNSDILVDRNYVIDSAIGIADAVSGVNGAGARIMNNGVIGNLTGIVINDKGASSLRNGRHAQVANNTIAFNDNGLSVVFNGTLQDEPISADVVNNIFANNHSIPTLGSASRSGQAIFASVPGRINLIRNMFSDNGASASSPNDDTVGVGGGFYPWNMSTSVLTGEGTNFLGNPDFVSPRDPRPQADGPAVFFIDANFDLMLTSDAIDNGLPGFGPDTDFRFRQRVDTPDKGFPYAGFGPTDIGAFEYSGTGGVAAGGANRVVSTSLSTSGSPVISAQSLSTSGVTVSFSTRVDRGSVQPTDLVLSGNGINSVSPARATSLSWIDDQTVRFNLSGQFRSSGTVNVVIPDGAIQSTTHQPLRGYSDSFTLTSSTGLVSSASVPPAPTPSVHAASVASTPIEVGTPTPAPAPTPAPVATTSTATAATTPASRFAALRQALLNRRAANYLNRIQNRLPRR